MNPKTKKSVEIPEALRDILKPMTERLIDDMAIECDEKSLLVLESCWEVIADYMVKLGCDTARVVLSQADVLLADDGVKVFLKELEGFEA